MQYSVWVRNANNVYQPVSPGTSKAEAEAEAARWNRGGWDAVVRPNAKRQTRNGEETS